MPDAIASEVVLYTDGACSGNPGPGGWAFILTHPATGKEMEASGDEATTTNNRMELTAVVRGLETLTRPTRVELVTDSTYVGKGLTEWMPKWKANGWRRRRMAGGPKSKTKIFGAGLDELMAQHQIKFTHVRGHTGDAENERCDQLAVAAYRKHL